MFTICLGLQVILLSHWPHVATHVASVKALLGLADRNKLHRLTERDSWLAHYFALLGVWGYVWSI